MFEATIAVRHCEREWWIAMQYRYEDEKIH